MSAPPTKPWEQAVADMVSELASVLECPVCLDAVVPPISQCMNGHLLCSTCHKKITTCPLCRAEFSNVRALALEKMAAKLPHPCMNSIYGCSTQLLLTQKPRHEEKCAFRPYTCVFTKKYSCKWTGLPANMTEHIRSAHPGESIQCGDKAVHILKSTAYFGDEARAVQSSFDHVFLLIIKRQEIYTQNIKRYLHQLLVQFVGYPEEANKFSLQLEMTGYNQTLTWTCTPSSVLENVSYVISQGDCLDFCWSRFTFGGDLTVSVTVRQRHTVESETTAGQ